jgi:hypothetical protein
VHIKANKLRRGFSPVAVLIGVVLVALAIVAFFAFKNIAPVIAPQPPPQVSQDPQVQSLNSQSSSDDVSAIDKDVSNTNLTNLDQGLDQTERDLSQVN